MFCKNLFWNTLLQTMEKITNIGQVLCAQGHHCQEANCDLPKQPLNTGFIATFIKFNFMWRCESLLWNCWGANTCSLLLTTIELLTSGRRAEWVAEHNSARFPEACQSSLNCWISYWSFLYADTSMTLILCWGICMLVCHIDVLKVADRNVFLWGFWPPFWLV